MDQHSSKKLKTVGAGGKVLFKCRCCGSYRHFVADWPHNIDNMDENDCKTDVRDEHIRL